jgi:hypothetical protein
MQESNLPTCERIRDKLARLRDLDQSCTAFGAGSHRYRLGKTLTAADLSSIEGRLGVKIPPEYRDFLMHVGHGGAGPAYGLFTLEDGEEENITDLQKLRKPFRWTERTKPSRPIQVPGALYISHAGCALRHFLVVNGRSCGELWFDRQAEEVGLEPVCNDDGERIGFLAWYEAWLDRELSNR